VLGNSYASDRTVAHLVYWQSKIRTVSYFTKPLPF
jgi:hypothetical protein